MQSIYILTEKNNFDQNNYILEHDLKSEEIKTLEKMKLIKL